MKFLPLIFTWLFYSSLLLAQDPLKYFPHHLGDIWEYWVDAGPGGYIKKQNEITKDSLGNDGRYYIESTWFGKFIVDTTTFEVYDWYGGYEKLYKLDADSGDSWIVWEDSSGGGYTIGLAVVVDVFAELIFNNPVTIKMISYYDYDIGAPESLWVGNRYLASDFGLVQADVELSAPYYFLRGAIIDSILYGNVTSINKSNKRESSGLSENFTLHQNYPNPFNPTTTIKYELPVAAKVELTVYDLLGKEVTRLVDARQPSGTYRLEFDGSEFSSGVYFYRLKINNKAVLSRKMVLIK